MKMQLIYANRGQALADEKFRLINNANETVSFQSDMGTYMCADRNRGNKRVSVDRTTIGPWEQWTIVFPGNGKIALRESEGQYASVAVKRAASHTLCDADARRTQLDTSPAQLGPFGSVGFFLGFAGSRAVRLKRVEVIADDRGQFRCVAPE